MTRSKRLATFTLGLILAGWVGLPIAAIAATCCRCILPSAPQTSICLLTAQTSCPGLPGTKANLKDLLCPFPVALTEAQCKIVSQGGVCTGAPAEDSLYKAPVAATTVTPSDVIKAPILNENIPGLIFTPTIPIQGQFIYVPWFGEYISAVYRYLTGVAVVAAAIMIVYGGFMYIIASSGAKVTAGKEIIKDAIIGPLQVARVRPIADSYMSGSQDASQTMKESGITPSPGAGISGAVSGSKLQIPRGECPGRSSTYQEPGDEKFAMFGNQKVQKRNYAICCNGKCLDDATIDFYMKEQERTGVPAADLMAQMVTEAGACSVFALASGRATDIHYNFGGIGCTKSMVPADACPNLAFPSTAYDVVTKAKVDGLGCDVFNDNQSALGPNCVKLCESSTRDNYTNCGDKCYAQKSHVAILKGGQEIWIPSVQCSRKFDTPQEFLDSHLGFVRACLPYNDSVYKFAYCIGASTYAGITGAKGIAIATIIERNCLCDPNTDSSGCKRDTKLEQDLAQNVVKKSNLYRLSIPPTYAPDYNAIVKALSDATQGRLEPGELNPQSDIIPPQTSL